MRQLVVAVSLTVTGVVFGMANSHHVELFYVFGEPIRMRLIFLLLIAFLCGLVVAWFYNLITRIRQERQHRGRWAGLEPEDEVE